jgi:hypothetical protein
MTWRGGIGCALTGMLLGVTGCWTGGDGLAFLRFDAADKGRTRTVHASLTAVSANAQAALQGAGLFFSLKRDGDNVISLKGTTPSGRRFTLVLTGIKSPEGEQTQIRVEWEKDPDDAFWSEFLVNLFSIQTGSVPQKASGTAP